MRKRSLRSLPHCSSFFVFSFLRNEDRLWIAICAGFLKTRIATHSLGRGGMGILLLPIASRTLFSMAYAT